MSERMTSAAAAGREASHEFRSGPVASSLLRMAGYGALLAIVTLIVAGVALALFFGGAGDLFGPINDIFTALTLLLLVPAILAVRRLGSGVVGDWFTWLSVLTIGGLLLAAAGFILLVVRVIELQTSFLTFGLGILPFMAWVAALAYVSLRHGLLSRTVGWWVVAFLAVTVLSLVALPFMPMFLISVTLAPAVFVTLGGGLIALGRDLLRRSSYERRTA
ncbi:hypothetical protein BH24CHL6_BH24CHL6_06880 [soil metagenome]